jgi:Fe2+ transport system protein A
MKNLSELKPGDVGFIENIAEKEDFRRHLIDMGMTPGTQVEVIRFAPFGDPIQIHIRGYELGIRKSEAKKILVRTKM